MLCCSCCAAHDAQWLFMLQHSMAQHSTAQHKIYSQINHSKEWEKLLMSSLCCATLVSFLWSVSHAGSGGSSQAAERAQQQASSKGPFSSSKTLPDSTLRPQVQLLLAYEHY